MPRPLLLPAVIAMSLAACSPAPAPASSPVPAASPAAPVAVVPAEVAPMNTSTPAPAAPAGPEATSSSTISGAIREGNRPPPALRVCAYPQQGGVRACIDTVAGATAYRLEVVAGRFIVEAEALDNPLLKFAHAERIRCIRAPCPPDTAIVVEVAAGEAKAGIDLTLGEALPPG